jgi:DNA-binding transcriptional ArsR family regulator
MNMQATEIERDALNAVTARFFKGLGDVNRLKILEFLRQGEKAAGEIVEHLGLPQNQVSMHLRCLRWCGYVNTRREGRYVLYSLGDDRVLQVIELARGILQGSEVHIMACDVIGECDDNLSNVTGWRSAAD